MIDLSQIKSMYDIDLSLVKQYLRIDEDNDLDDLELSLYIQAAINFIEDYVDESCLNSFTLIIPALMLIENCYENKTIVVEANTKVNEIYDRFLYMYRGISL